MIEEHKAVTTSAVADNILRNWTVSLTKFHKVIPIDYKRALQQQVQQARLGAMAEVRNG